MANYPIYRLVKGSTLTFTEMDDNLEWLSRTMSASVVTITGSTFVLGDLTVSDGITGSLYGTSSWAVSASWAPSSPSSVPTSFIASGSVTASVNVNNTAFNLVSSSNTIFSVNNNGGITGSLHGTSSWSINAITASNAITSISSSYPIAVTGSSIYSTGPSAGVPTSFSKEHGIFLGHNAGFETIDTGYSIFLGESSGYKAREAYGAFFFGNNAGYSASFANNSFFIGYQAGNAATYADNSNFIGLAAGQNAARAYLSNFIGLNAGYAAISASNSNFIGTLSGNNAKKASYSTLIGYQAGLNSNSSINGIGSNNIVIGTNITLANDINNAINIGGLLFGTGSYSNSDGSPFSGSANGRVGINQPTPIFNLDVSGSGRYTNGLTVTGSITGSNALLTGTLTVQTIVAQTITSSTDFVTGSTRFGSLVTNTHQFTGSVLAPSITGSLQGTSSWAVSASWAPSSPSSVPTSFIASGSVSASVNVGNTAFNLVSSSNNLVTVLSNGNVGIGTTTPSQSLDVNGRIRVGSNPKTEIYSGADRLVFRGDNIDNVAQMTGYGIFLPITDQIYNLYQAGSTLLGYTDTTASLDIARGGSGATVYVRLNSNGDSYLNGGNIGIGTTNPNSKLDVSGSGRYTNGLTITGSVLAPSITGSLQGTSSWAVSASWAPSSPSSVPTSFIATGSITASVNADPTASFKVTSGSNTLLTLTKDSKLVIGTPGEFIDYQLEVSGAIKGDYLYCNSNGSIASSLYGVGQLLTGATEQPTVYLDSTWNTTAEARGIEYTVTNTASSGSSKLLNLKVDGASKFNVNVGGAIQTAEPTGYVSQPWKLGDATAGTLTPDTYIKVEINGQIYSIPALLGTP